MSETVTYLKLPHWPIFVGTRWQVNAIMIPVPIGGVFYDAGG